MCTAISFNVSHHLFSRTLDLESSYGERVVCTPRRFQLKFRHEKPQIEHYSIIGVGQLVDNTPLYYDAFNESGLAAAALNFPKNAVYFDKNPAFINVASYELISFVLSRCANLSEAVALLDRINITSDSFSDELTATPLHWIFADKSGAITVESVSGGLKIYENRLGVITNSPEFSYHLLHTSDFMSLDSSQPKNKISPTVNLSYYSGGLGALGLPGDFSSASRFIRAVFLKNHSVCDDISHAFHIMDSLSVPKGAVIREDNKPFMTVYTSVADTVGRVYYFTTAQSRRIRAVLMSEALMNSDAISVFEMNEEEKIFYINKGY